MVNIRLAENLSVASEKLFSYHVGIAGSTGSGKSRNVSARLLKECLRKKPEGPDGVRYAFIVVDTNSEYFTFQDAYPKQVIVFSPDATKGVPFRISGKNITVDEVSAFLKEITKREVSRSELAALFLAVDELRARSDYTLEQVYEKLYELEAYSILPSYEKMMRTGIFGSVETPLSLLVRPGEASIIDIGGYSTEIQAIIFAHLARRLFHARTNKSIPCTIIFLEEASVFAPEGKLAPSSEIVRTIATQARGYDLILVSIFQRSSLTDITLRSQIHNWIVGKTGNPLDRQAIMKAAEKIEAEHDKVIKNLAVGRQFLVTGHMVDKPKVIKIPDQKILARKGGRIPQKAIDESFKREDLASYIEQVRRTEESERKRLVEAVAELRAERGAQIKRPQIPKKAQQEIDKLKRSFEDAQRRYQDAIERADKRAGEKYVARIKELETQVERLTKELTLKGVAVESVWEHPLVQKRLNEKLTEQKHSLVEFLEKAGPSLPQKMAAFLGCKPQSLPSRISEINKEIPDLIGYNVQNGTYFSRLKQIFPVTEAAKQESMELKETKALAEELQRKVAAPTQERSYLLSQIATLKERQSSNGKVAELTEERDRLAQEVDRLRKELAATARGFEEKLRGIQHEKAAAEEQLVALKEKVAKFSTLEDAIREAVGQIRGTLSEDGIRKIVKDELAKASPKVADTSSPVEGSSASLREEILAEVRKMVEATGAGSVLRVADKVTNIEVRDHEETVLADSSTLRGGIALLIAKYGFMQQRHNLAQFVEELTNRGWLHGKKEVESELQWFCQAGIMYRKISTGRVYWYSLVPSMEQRIRFVE
jgi:hypothetical protein